MKTYKKCTIRKTEVTTDDMKIVFGVPRPCIGYLYEITGKVNKKYGSAPFITSESEVKKFINYKLEG